MRVFFCSMLLLGCTLTATVTASWAEKVEPAPPVTLPFSYVGDHLLRVSATLDDKVPADFILNTGIGLNVLDRKLAEQLGYQPKGNYVGKRMSGQTLDVPLTNLGSLTLGGIRQPQPQMALWNMAELLPHSADTAGVRGFLSLTFFRSQPFTLDYTNHRLILETPDSLHQRQRDGDSVALRLDQDQSTTLTAWLQLDLPELTPAQSGSENGMSAGGGMGGGGGRHGGGRHQGNHSRKEAWAEVDTGSPDVILNADYMKIFHIDPQSSKVRAAHGTDETGHPYDRYFATLPDSVRLYDAHKVRLEKPEVMFQNILYTGLLGDEFLRQFTVTYDLPDRKLIFARPPAGKT